MQEVWKDVKGYEGLYQISNLGRIKSLERIVINNQYGGARTIKEALLHPTDNGNGYKIIGLKKACCRKNFYIHRLVAEHFLANPFNKKYVNHIDFDKSNNSLTNLEWCTQKENVKHSIEHMKKPKSRCRPSSTGYKYIGFRNGKYRLHMKHNDKFMEKTFNTLSEAIEYRNKIIEGVI